MHFPRSPGPYPVRSRGQRVGAHQSAPTKRKRSSAFLQIESHIRALMKVLCVRLLSRTRPVMAAR